MMTRALRCFRRRTTITARWQTMSFIIATTMMNALFLGDNQAEEAGFSPCKVSLLFRGRSFCSIAHAKKTIPITTVCQPPRWYMIILLLPWSTIALLSFGKMSGDGFLALCRWPARFWHSSLLRECEMKNLPWKCWTRFWYYSPFLLLDITPNHVCL